MVLTKWMQNATVDIEKIDSRLMKAKFSCKGADLNIINHHAPQSLCSETEKHRHWHKLEMHANRIPHAQPVIIVGDTNARLHGRLNDVEEEVIGKHCFHPSMDNIRNLQEEEMYNRQELVDFCIKNGYVVSNSYFKKKPQKKCTYSTSKPFEFKAPWSKEPFEELDLFLTKTEWRNIVEDVEAKINYAFNSDHVPVVAETNIKIRAHKRDAKISSKGIERRRKNSHTATIRKSWTNMKSGW